MAIVRAACYAERHSAEKVIEEEELNYWGSNVLLAHYRSEEKAMTCGHYRRTLETVRDLTVVKVRYDVDFSV